MVFGIAIQRPQDIVGVAPLTVAQNKVPNLQWFPESVFHLCHDITPFRLLTV
jgi:hypothetical protein